MKLWNVIPILLLPLLSLVLGAGAVLVALLLRRAHRNRLAQQRPPALRPGSLRQGAAGFSGGVVPRPACWLAVRSRNLLAVQSALGLHNPRPCSWQEGLAGEKKLFIAPPVNGWILVVGSGLPEPADDVDSCFRFVTGLSRKLGQVQFFSAHRALHHHAWIQANGGHIVRAYAWAGKTLWHQGRRTPAEEDLGLTCFDYTETVQPALAGQREVLDANVDKLPLLAARWSLDPAGIDEAQLERERGVAGEPSGRF